MTPTQETMMKLLRVLTYMDGFGDTYTGIPGRFASAEAAQRRADELPAEINPRVEYFHRGHRIDYHVLINWHAGYCEGERA